MLSPGPALSARSFQLSAIPMREIRASIISALTKIQQRLFRRFRQPNILIHQEEFALLSAIERLCGLYGAVLETGWFRRGISVERGVLNDLSISRPKSRTDDLVRVTLFRDYVGIRTGWGAPARETRRRQIETSPKEMYRTGLSNEPRPKRLQNRGDGREDPPETMRIFAVV